MRPAIFCLLMMFFIGCKPRAAKEVSITEIIRTAKVEEHKNVSWHITGTEPFWSMYIHNDTFIYSRLSEKIDTVYFKMDNYIFSGDSITYWLSDPDKQQAKINIFQSEKPCSDGMSDKAYSFHATALYKNERLNGCAEK
ncbi:MAG: hypothetical protein JWN78_2610 [Bacteroidota bacterium]|nr:hypothetical protein [Bacteroidota bacterium]